MSNYSYKDEKREANEAVSMLIKNESDDAQNDENIVELHDEFAREGFGLKEGQETMMEFNSEFNIDLVDEQGMGETVGASSHQNDFEIVQKLFFERYPGLAKVDCDNDLDGMSQDLSADFLMKPSPMLLANPDMNGGQHTGGMSNRVRNADVVLGSTSIMPQYDDHRLHGGALSKAETTLLQSMHHQGTAGVGGVGDDLDGIVSHHDCTSYKGRLHYVKYVQRDGKPVKIWECGVCSKEFGHQYTLMRHLPTHTDERKFQCNTCGKAFRQMSTLSQHRAIHSSERPYVCELCKKTFNRVSTLISHRKTHSGLKPHQCHLCHKAFHQKGNLRNHIFTHTNERPYKCDICQKGFNQMSNLMCHKLKAHQRNDKPKFTCTICGKEFPKRTALRNHEEYKHGIKQVQNLSHPEIQTRIVQGENGEKMHIIHIPEMAPTAPLGTATTRVRYTNGVLVDAIQTTAMRQALQAQQNGNLSPSCAPFALLRPIGGIPVLVRVLTAPQGKHMLVPATAEDLRAYGKITVTENGVVDGNVVSGNDGGGDNNCGDNKTTTVQIKIPVVATVVQKFEPDGTVSMSVESPGPENKQFINEPIVNPIEETYGNDVHYLPPNYAPPHCFNMQSDIDESNAAVSAIQMEESKDPNIYVHEDNVQIDNFEIIEDTKPQCLTNYKGDIILDNHAVYSQNVLYDKTTSEYNNY